MYISDIENFDERYMIKVLKDESTFAPFYNFWREHLLERVQRMFVYDGREFRPNKDGKIILPQKEIEMPLYFRGHVGILDYKHEMSAFNGNLHGVTKYVDEFTHYSCFSPIDSFERKIDEDIVIIDNTSLRNPLLPLIDHYAILLAHADVTLQDALINVRDCGGVPIATTEKQKKSIEEYQNKVYKGQYGVVTDIGNLGLQFVGGSRGTGQTLKEIYEVREKLIKSFYQALGIRGAFEKNNNAVDSEVTSDSALLQVNIHDMLECRKKGIEKINNLFGTDWSVELAKEIADSFVTYGDNEDENSKTDGTESNPGTKGIIE